MISLILVSHSRKITDGLKEMIDEMTLNQENVTVFSAGGLSAGELGTDPIAIYNTILSRQQDAAILIFTDMGSAILSSEAAIDLLDDDIQKKVYLIDGPLVEGAFVAAIQTDGTANVDSIMTELATITER